MPQSAKFTPISATEVAVASATTLDVALAALRLVVNDLRKSEP